MRRSRLAEVLRRQNVQVESLRLQDPIVVVFRAHPNEETTPVLTVVKMNKDKSALHRYIRNVSREPLLHKPVILIDSVSVIYP